MAVVSYLTLLFWATFFIWLWFAVFILLFFYEGLGLAPWTRTSSAPSAPPAPHH
jgi:hypothetical protein